MKATDALEKAAEILAERGKGYDQGQERSMGKIVAAFNAITGKNLTEAEGWMFMQCLKLTRAATKPSDCADSLLDNVCYGALLAESLPAESKNEEKASLPEYFIGDWIDFNGTSRPVPKTQKIIGKYRDGTLAFDGAPRRAMHFYWDKHYLNSDLVAYRLVSKRVENKEKSQGSPASDGWIEWNGGECPVDPVQRVLVRLKNDELDKGIAANFAWGRNAFGCLDGGFDIVAYKLV